MIGKLKKHWVWGVVAAPFVLMILLHLGIAIFEYTGFNFNIQGVDAPDWFIFAGSYMGGVMTLVGVILTIHYQRKSNFKQQKFTEILKERETLGNIISRLDLLGPSGCYQEYTSLVSAEYAQIPNLSNIRRNIVDKMGILNQLRAEINLSTDIMAMPTECASCNHQCRLISLRPEFQVLYTTVNQNLLDAYAALDTFIVASLNNCLIEERKLISMQQNYAAQSQGKAIPYTQSFFNELDSRKIHTKDLEQKVRDKLNIITGMNSNEYVRLITLCREYSFIKIQNIENVTEH